MFDLCQLVIKLKLLFPQCINIHTSICLCTVQIYIQIVDSLHDPHQLQRKLHVVQIVSVLNSISIYSATMFFYFYMINYSLSNLLTTYLTISLITEKYLGKRPMLWIVPSTNWVYYCQRTINTAKYTQYHCRKVPFDFMLIVAF